MENQISDILVEIAENFRRMANDTAEIAAAGAILVQAVKNGKKVIFCGNGGSAADSQHLAAEFMGRFLIERAPLPAISLTVDTSAITAIGNDYGYDMIFERQLRGLGVEGDVLVGISTSGSSKNVVKALEYARVSGIRTIGLTGPTGGPMRELCEICISAQAARTDHIQELHIAIGHILCGIVECSL